jgi:hypothetical protein
MHPLAEDFSQLKDAEIESRVSELGKKYWQSSNPALQNQISMFLELYNEELRSRRAKVWQQQYQNRDKGLDKLINVK